MKTTIENQTKVYRAKTKEKTAQKREKRGNTCIHICTSIATYIYCVQNMLCLLYKNESISL